MTTSTSGSGGPIDFDGGWQIPDSGMMPPLVGDGGITVEIGPGADASSPGKFGGPATGSAPTLVYPPNGVILPPNTNSLEFHFIPAPGQTLFEFVFHAPTTDLHVFVGCTPLGSGCVYKPDATFWSSLVAYARGTQPVTYTLKGVNGGSPAAVGTTAPASIAFSQQDMTGGIYYWNTAGVVQRYDYGIPTAAPQLYLSAADVGGLFCVGCHVLSRDGDRIAAGADIPSPAPYKVLDVVSKAPVYAGGQPLSGQSNFFSFSPDGKQLLLSDGVAIGWRDLVNGNIVNPQVVNPGTMPDWSPDGLHMVYARPKNPPPFNFPVPGVDSAAIMTMHFNGTSWDTPVTLVPFAGQNNYYPAYAPTGQWIVFNRSPSNAESFANAGPDPDAGTVPDGELWAVAASGGAAVRLDKASNPGACSWPKWAPVLHDYYGGKLMWLTVSSARAYGLRLAAGAQTQLWMVGFDPARAALGQDPSFPGFWLPFQDIGGGNHIAQWTTKVPRKPCTMPTDCPSSEICKNGHCVPPG
jgi:TolB protein